MNLEGQTQIQINNRVFTLGSPVVHAETLEQLAYVFQQQGIEGRPIVVINPVEDRVSDLPNLLENYIENAMQGLHQVKVTTYMFQDATDDDIRKWAEAQYQRGSGQSLDYLIETGKGIREQSKLKHQLDMAKAKQTELWRQHCLHPESQEGSEEYANLSYNVIPQIESALQQVTEALQNIPKDINLGTAVAEPVVEDVPTVVDEPVIEEGESCEFGSPSLSFKTASNLIMPIEVARKAAESSQNQIYLKQQQTTVPGYKTVPLEYLLALGIRLYADGVPVVYTKSGTFMRVGKSSVSPLKSSYWYPVPRYK